MASRLKLVRNEYRAAVETNQSGKLCVRVRARFGRHEWTLNTYFLASALDRALKKLEQLIQYLQEREDWLFFWGVERSDDPKFSEELLLGAGVKLDRRKDFPERAASLSLSPEKPAPAFLLAPMRRRLALSVQDVRAAASD
jgi:hypothetical protein